MFKDDSDYLMMSGIQHFYFCKRQWGLIHLEQQWVENVQTAKGRIEHSRCHDKSIHERRGDLLIVRGLQVSSSSLHLSGQCDVVEFHEDENGVPISYCDGLWIPYPIEYKHGKPKESDADRLQLCAQVIALEEMLSCSIEKAALYYAEIHHREEVIISEKLRDMTFQMAEEMMTYYRRGYTPKSKKKKACNSCSLKEICLPQIIEKDNVEEYINRMIRNEE